MKFPLLAACEGALLVVDAGQGVQAQSLANVHLAFERNLEIVPVINKIDLPTADIEGVQKTNRRCHRPRRFRRHLLLGQSRALASTRYLERIIELRSPS